MADMRADRSAQKLAKNCNFFEKSAENLGNEHFSANLWHITGTYACAQKLQFFSIFEEKWLKIEGIQLFQPKSWHICGSLFKMDLHKNCNFFGNSNTNALKIGQIMGDMQVAPR